MIKPISSYGHFSKLHFSSRQNQKQNNEVVEKNASNVLMRASLGTIIAFGASAAMISQKTSFKLVNNVSAIKNKMNKYTNDVLYRKKILSDMKLPESDYYKLYSIIGADEFDVVVKDLSKDKQNFLPGKKTFRADKEPIYGKENVESGKFAANMHLHTVYSDGALTVPELLEQAVIYADSRVKKLGEDFPFYLAITDHDTLAGCKEAVEMILKSPQKYKNLRLILGVENTVITSHPEYLKAPVETHMISYCINPFDKELVNYYNKPLQENRKNIEQALDYANETYFTTLRRLGTGYTLEEFDRYAPEAKYRNFAANYLTKDYLQFRLIYSAMVEKNLLFLESVGLKSASLDFVAPRKLIGENLDYSKGQRYYDYYLEAVKSDLKSKLPKEKHSEVDVALRYIPEDIKKILEEIEASVGDATSELHAKSVEFPKFDVAIEFLKTKDGSLGIAHPGVAFPMSNLKSEEEIVKFYDYLYAEFKKFGAEKAKYAEDHYAVYFEAQSEEYLNNLATTSAKYNLDKTGGLDTHISDIFSSK